MVNIANVAQASMLLKQDKVLLSEGVTVTDSAMKASWNTMISCVFSLLFPYIHQVFATRDELQVSMTQELQEAFNKHHNQNIHIWGGAITAVSGGFTFIPMGKITVPTLKEITLTKVTRPTQVVGGSPTGALGDDFPDIELGVPSFQPIMAYAMSMTNKYLVT